VDENQKGRSTGATTNAESSARIALLKAINPPPRNDRAHHRFTSGAREGSGTTGNLINPSHLQITR